MNVIKLSLIKTVKLKGLFTYFPINLHQLSTYVTIANFTCKSKFFGIPMMQKNPLNVAVFDSESISPGYILLTPVSG